MSSEENSGGQSGYYARHKDEIKERRRLRYNEVKDAINYRRRARRHYKSRVEWLLNYSHAQQQQSILSGLWSCGLGLPAAPSGGGTLSYGLVLHQPLPPPATSALPYVEHHSATTIRNGVNLNKETLKLEKDEDDPDRFLVTFTFDSMVAGSINIFFFAKKGKNWSLTTVKPHIFTPVKMSFQKGLGQKFRQPSGTGIDLSLLDEVDLTKEGLDELFPLVIRADAFPTSQIEYDLNSANQQIGNPLPKSVNSQITQAVLEKKDSGEYQVKVIKQILWVDGVQYELQEIYGIGNSAGTDNDANDSGKDCVVCMSEPMDTTVLPCRHMCMCSGCAKVLRSQIKRCPICRRSVEQLLEIKVNKTKE